MIVETKYNIGDKVFFISSNEIKEVHIKEISILVVDDKYRIDYRALNGQHGIINEKNLYTTKQEAAHSWLKQAGLEIGFYEE